MTELPVRGFWSYVHDDDRTDEGRILQLATDLQSEFAALTAGSLELFVDRSSLEWGADWRAKINEAIAQAAFLIPVITPRYFTSQACRDELLAFAAQAEAAGVPDLVLPVYWIEVRELENDPSVDEVTALVAARQRQDLRIARLEDRGSSAYRQAVNRLAKALADQSERLAAAIVEVPVVGVSNDSEEDDEEEGSLGVLETLGQGEVALEAITPTLEELGQQIATVGDLVRAGAAEMSRAEARGQGFQARIRVAARLAQELREPAERIAHLGQEYGANMRHIDPMVRVIINAAHDAEDPEERAAADGAVEAIMGMVRSSEEAMQHLRELVDSVKGGARLSSTMRPVLRELNRGLQGVLDSSTVFGEWKTLIEHTDDEGPAA